MATRGYENFTQADADRRQAQKNLALTPKVKSKFRNVKTSYDGETFDSGAEAEYWMGLKLRERAGEIYNLKRQVHWPLHCPVQNVLGITVQVAEYISDFEFDEAGEHVICDLKGAKETQIFKLKNKWLTLEYGVSVRIVR